MTSYQVNYDGYYVMRDHDKEENALKRWFDNYKIERYAWFATEYESLIVTEVDCTSKRRGKRFVCVIENEGAKQKREVIMDHLAPPAPMLTFAAKRKYVPPPPKSPEEIRREMEWEHMYRKGYRPYIVRVPVMPPRLDFGKPFEFDLTQSYIEEVRWERPRDYFDPRAMETVHPAPVPKHRRNV